MSDTEFQREWSRWEHRDLLVSLCGGEELATLIYRVNGPQSINFLDARPAALEGRTPRSLLQTRKGRQTLRRALMKFPYI